MLRFVASRLLQFPVVLGVIYLLTFVLVWLAPGTPFGNGERALDPKVLAVLEQRFHADHWYHFVGYYPWQIVRHGDLGPSMSYLGWSVNDILRESLRVSVQLGLVALVIATLLGTLVGTLAAVHRGGVFDAISLSVALLGISVPSFVAAGLMIGLFCDRLHWLPAAGWGDARQVVLPAAALSLLPLAYVARLTRVSMLDVLGDDYIRTARAKGLRKSAVIWKHAFRNAFLPVFTYLGPAAAETLTGSFVVEKVFNIPGLGQHFVNAVLNRDRTLILGTVLIYSSFLLTLNLLVDVGYAFIDPRIDVTR